MLRLRLDALALLLGPALLACGGSDDPGDPGGPGGTGTGNTGPSSGPGGQGGSGGEGTCPAFDAIQVVGEPRPGASLELSVAPYDAEADYNVAWTVSLGTTAGALDPNAVSWALPSDVAVHVAETATASARVTQAGCPDLELEASITIDWPLSRRVVVIHNPSAAGSSDVAAHYQKMRGLEDDQLCAIASADITVLPGADLAAWVDALLACVDAVGPQVHYLVPVWGVPIKVEGRIDDLAGGAKKTTSLDALIAYGATSKAMGAPVYNPYYQDGDSPTGTYDPFVPFGELRAAEPGNDYFMVARIDGADADAAKALVDRTAQAEELAARRMLAGIVYVDGNRGLPHPATDVFGSYEGGEWNIIGVETVFTDAALYPVVADYDNAEFGTAPAPLECPEALYYAGWYSFGNYNDVFTWQPGAIGGHLDSCSACDLRGDKDWSARALRKGITATFGAVNEPYVAGMPEYDQFFAYLLQGASYGEAAAESTVVGAWMMVWVGDPLYRPYAK